MRSTRAVLAAALLAGLLPIAATAGAPPTDPAPAAVAPASWPAEPTDAELASAARRPDGADEVYAFLLPDRFAQGDPGNDTGGYAGTKLDHGHDPTDKAFYHGGDLAGVRQKLDYLAGMGTTAVWLAPVFKNRPVQTQGTTSSAGYHGYWITDYTQVDPHFGTNDDLRRLVDEAHARGIKVFFDIIPNHTADVLAYDDVDAAQRQVARGTSGALAVVQDAAARAQGAYRYRDKAAFPYRDADGKPFDDKAFAGGSAFPRIDARTSFPYRPVTRTAADETVKVPAWLNDPTMYHNRGDSTFSGESSEYGDFVGLDDLWTERPEVVQGMIDIHAAWVRFGIDGFRIDTVKHVNTEFWQAFAPAMLEVARERGDDDFFMFGEVFDGNPAYLSSFTTTARLPGVLDFAFQWRATDFAARSRPTDGLRDLFAADDLYTDADSSADDLPTFLGNHDMGRIGHFLRQAQPLAADPELVARDRLAHALMFTVRGQPVVYAGDEQGFTGDGGDQAARQTQFGSQVATYNDDDLIGTDATHATARFDQSHPVYATIRELSAALQDHPALRTGAQIHRSSGPAAGVFAFSRVHRDERVEYVVALNNSPAGAFANFPTATPGAAWTPVVSSGAGTLYSSSSDADVTVQLPAFGWAVWRADRAVPVPAEAPAVQISSPAPGGGVEGRAEVRATVSTDAPVAVSFAVQEGDGPWRVLGEDLAPPYRVTHDVRHLADGTPVRYKVVVDDLTGRLASDRTAAAVGPARCTAGDPGVVVFHYQRPAGDYDGWGLYLWEDVDASEQTTWPANRPFRFSDDYGRWSCVRVTEGADRVGFIVQRAGVKDTEPDRFLDPRTVKEVWLRQGDATVYTSRPD